MAPNLFGTSGVLLAEATIEDPKSLKSVQPEYQPQPQKRAAEPYPGTDKNYKWTFVWRNTLAFIYLHIAAFYGYYLMFTKANASTNIWCKYSNSSTFEPFRSNWHACFSRYFHDNGQLGGHGRLPPTLGPSLVQSQVTPEDHPHDLANHGVPEPHLRMVSRPQGAPQVHRHRRRSPQRQSRSAVFIIK